VQELRKSMTEEELIHWAAYYEIKNDREKQEMNRQKAKSR
jgi:hypothetical protein|tara:strand:- start:1395 stop:1514 length:120 start_codon:yes stop_codon:yes gene_type:complete